MKIFSPGASALRSLASWPLVLPQTLMTELRKDGRMVKCLKGPAKPRLCRQPMRQSSHPIQHSAF